jgi:hypothetical protein
MIAPMIAKKPKRTSPKARTRHESLMSRGSPSYQHNIIDLLLALWKRSRDRRDEEGAEPVKGLLTLFLGQQLGARPRGRRTDWPPTPRPPPRPPHPCRPAFTRSRRDDRRDRRRHRLRRPKPSPPPLPAHPRANPWRLSTAVQGLITPRRGPLAHPRRRDPPAGSSSRGWGTRVAVSLVEPP